MGGTVCPRPPAANGGGWVGTHRDRTHSHYIIRDASRLALIILNSAVMEIKHGI